MEETGENTEDKYSIRSGAIPADNGGGVIVGAVFETSTEPWESTYAGRWTAINKVRTNLAQISGKY